MEVKANAIVLRAADYGENDKILTLLSDCGRISAGIKGVKKAGAKLKFASQPFFFGEFLFAKRGDRYTVTGCTEAESFYDLRTDIMKFYAASSAAEAALSLTADGQDCGEIFVAILNTYAQMCRFDEAEELIKFLLFALKSSGYAISLSGCPHCGKDLFSCERLRFDMSFGAFTCTECSDGAGASLSTLHLLKKAAGEDFNPAYFSPDAKKRALRLLKEYFFYKTDARLKSLAEYIRLL